jgi:hypothetical protein
MIGPRDPVIKTAHPAERRARETLLTVDGATASTAERCSTAKKTKTMTNDDHGIDTGRVSAVQNILDVSPLAGY